MSEIGEPAANIAESVFTRRVIDDIIVYAYEARR